MKSSADFANDVLFAGRASILAAQSINGRFEDILINGARDLCALRNLSQFVDGAGVVQQTDGLCWQRYFDCEVMNTLVKNGVFQDHGGYMRMNEAE